MKKVKINDTTYFVLNATEPRPEYVPNLSLILRQTPSGKHYATNCGKMSGCRTNCLFYSISCSPTTKEVYETLKLTDRYATTKALPCKP